LNMLTPNLVQYALPREQTDKHFKINVFYFQ
jgi:hypothetical protein